MGGKAKREIRRLGGAERYRSRSRGGLANISMQKETPFAAIYICEMAHCDGKTVYSVCAANNPVKKRYVLTSRCTHGFVSQSSLTGFEKLAVYKKAVFMNRFGDVCLQIAGKKSAK